MHVYLCYTASGEWDDYHSDVEVIYSSLEDAKAWFKEQGYTQSGVDRTSSLPQYERRDKLFEEEPQRSWYDSEEEYTKEKNRWLDEIENDCYYGVEYWSGWIECRKVM
jgi:hypothetical protein